MRIFLPALIGTIAAALATSYLVGGGSAREGEEEGGKREGVRGRRGKGREGGGGDLYSLISRLQRSGLWWRGASSHSPCGGVRQMVGGEEPNVELELRQDMPLDRVVQTPPYLQLILVKCLPPLCLGEEFIHAWLQLLQNLQAQIISSGTNHQLLP